MMNPKDILVTTTSSVEGLRIKRYLKPVSAHVVAGTNIFSDFFASFSDFFGGRSRSYQKQLTSLYNDAIERVKYAAYEVGANCVIGLSIDMDEISGKGKSMFMLTAVGTAVILEKGFIDETVTSGAIEIMENVGVERINLLRSKKAIIDQADSGNLNLNEDVWNFLTVNHVEEVFPLLLKKFSAAVTSGQPEVITAFYRLFVNYVDALPDPGRLELLYGAIRDEQSNVMFAQLASIVKELSLFDYERTMALLNSDDFRTRKKGLRISVFDKPFFNQQDIEDLQKMRVRIKTSFTERGVRSTKKQLLSSKEKEVWSCECGKSNEIGDHCGGCQKDIYGFYRDDIHPTVVDNFIKQKIELIAELIR